jgi:hypothetical protein
MERRKDLGIMRKKISEESDLMFINNDGGNVAQNF